MDKSLRMILNWSERQILPLLLLILLLFTPLFATNSAAQVPISFGQTISASISVPGEQDIFSFEADVGDVVLVRMSTATNLDPYIELYDPNGSFLKSGIDSVGPGTAAIKSDALPALWHVYDHGHRRGV